jgi:nicotinamide phosphoribosyltransferase
MTVFNAAVHTDYYKTFHKMAYDPAITKVYSNFTSRNGRLSNVPKGAEVMFVGLQYFVMDFLINEWNETFFKLPKATAVVNIKRYVDSAIGVNYDASHFEALHDLGYLPLQVKALPEGTLVPYGVSPVTFTNTVDGFQWLPNYLETVFSNENWPIQTSATTSVAYLKNTVASFKRAGLTLDLVPFMCHDFSARGMFGRQASAMSGFGHLCSFAGTDTIAALAFAEKYYGANVDTELVGASCAATEHSTTTSFILSLVEEKGISKLEAEIEYVRYLMSVVPTGILSHVSDSFDFWAFVTEGLPVLKGEILARKGKLVIRPDSGDPVKVLCGDPEGKSEAERKGLVECLWDIFGGTLSPTGLKVLHENIGGIFGDSITLQRQENIIDQLEHKGFAALVVLGVGSFSYQYVTRDTHGSAVKTTYVEKSGKGVNIFKDPATDSKKKSACGLLRIERENGKLVQYDQQTPEQEAEGLLETVFLDGQLVRKTTLQEIRQRVREQLESYI